MVLRHTDDSVRSWQRPGPRRRLVFALVGVLIALSYVLLLAGEEAQAKGGKQSPNGGSAEGAIGGSAKPAREGAGDVNKLVGKEEAGRKEAEGKEAAVAPRDQAPRADRPSPVDDGPTRNATRSATTDQVAGKDTATVDQVPKTDPTAAERRGLLGESTGTAGDVTKPAVEPDLDGTTSVVRPVLGEATEPLVSQPLLDEATTRLPKAEPNLEIAPPVVEPVLNRVVSESGPVLERATAPVSPVLEKTASTVEPVLEETNPPVESALAETLPAVEPALDGAIPAAAEPFGEAIGPVVRPRGEEAIPTAGPVLEEAAFPGVEPAIRTAAPVFEPVSETVAPVVGSGFGEGIVRQSAGPPVLEDNAGAVPTSLSALPSHALAVEARGALPDARPAPATLGSAWDYGPPVRDESPASAVEPPGVRSGLFDGSFVIDGSHAALLGAITAEDAREGMPRSLPFGFPSVAPPVGISFGSSGAGVALYLLAILALLPVLSRAGGLSRSTREAFKLGSSLRLAVERPG